MVVVEARVQYRWGRFLVEGADGHDFLLLARMGASKVLC